MKLKAIFPVGIVAVPALALAVNVVIVDTNGNEVGECTLAGAAIAQAGGDSLTIDSATVTATSKGDLLLVIDQTATGCAIGGATNQAPTFAQSNPYDAGTVNVSSSRNISLNASDPDGDTLTWSISSQPASGMGTATVSGTGNNNTVTYTAGNTAGTAEFVVQIDDGKGGTASLTVRVTVSSTPLPAECQDIPPVSGITEDTTPWNGPYDNSEYEFLADTGGQTYSVRIERTKYKTKYGAGVNDGSYGKISFEATAGFSSPAKLITISKCPGDFGGSAATQVPTGCMLATTRLAPTFYWKTTGAVIPDAAIPSLYKCELQPNTPYYFNVIYAEDNTDIANTLSCADARCGFQIKNTTTLVP